MTERNTRIRSNQIRNVLPVDIDATNAAVDTYVPSYDLLTEKFTWISKYQDKIQEGDTYIECIDAGDGYIKFVEDNSEIMRISGGLVGIGGSPTTYKLEVFGKGYFQSGIRIQTGQAIEYGAATEGIYGSAAGQTLYIYAGILVNICSVLYVDNTNDRVGIGTSSPSELLHIVSATSTKPLLLIEGTNADAQNGGVKCYKNSASPADDDILGFFFFSGKDSGANILNYGYMYGQSADVTDGDEAGTIAFDIRIDGELETFLKMTGYNGNVGQGYINLNVGKKDIDVFISGDNETNLFYVDAANDRVGIFTNAPTAKLDVNSDIIRLRTSKTPATAGAAGNAGDICWDSSYIYVCIAASTWMRATLNTW